MMRILRLVALFVLVHSAAFAQQVGIPAGWRDALEVLTSGDPGYEQAAGSQAVQDPGKGGVSMAMVVRLTRDMPVYRLWSGPAKLNASGQTNRLGAWWSFDRPHGAVSSYRNDYEICLAWNDLTWVATCTLKRGAVVAIGPGQSVAVETCNNPAGLERYGANDRDWQVYVNQPWSRPASEFECPPASADYFADPADIGRKLN
jgi:hypothetical protein